MDGWLGELKMFAGTFAPRNWAFCEGQLLAINQYQSLFAIIGDQFGGDGRTNFALPDLRGRVPIGAGTGPGLTPRRPAERGGTEITQLSVNEMPSHSHTVQCDMKTGGRSLSADPENHIPAKTTQGEAYGADLTGGTHMETGMISNTGGGTPFNNMQPYLGVNYIICLVGEFPPRN